MTKENQKVFLFSAESANSFGYNIGLKKDGSKVTYTAICSHEDEYNWADKRTVYKGKTEDFLAIKNFDYQNGKVTIISNQTDDADPFVNAKNSQKINLEIDKSGSMGEKPNKLSINFDYLKGGTDLSKPLVDIDKIAGKFKQINKLLNNNDSESGEKKPKIK